MRVSDTAELVMEDRRIPGSNILGEPGYGFIDAMKVLDGGRISIGALSVGIARGAYEAVPRLCEAARRIWKPISISSHSSCSPTWPRRSRRRVYSAIAPRP